MIDLYTWTTPNGRKLSILLEELGIDYEAHAVNISEGEQKSPEFLEISPTGKIPAIRVRATGQTVMESGAIMLWLAEREKRFLGAPDDKASVLEWLMWQMSAQGPALGRIHQFAKYGNPLGEPAETKAREQGARAYADLDARLADRDFVSGSGRGVYTIADMAIWPWVSRYEWHETDLHEYPNVLEWYRRLAEWPAVQRGYHSPHFVNDVPMP
ncbi:MAG: glutathione S-transferase [Boseongicola sp.]|nr:glutathione S-transferase N-terminal domain-containing protein [Boseongicola sp.]NNL18109.1 glutathione S-transferase [Boseongicola sp.]